MPTLVNISQLYDKDIFARKRTNLRNAPSMDLGKIIRVVDAGSKIGRVQTYVNGYTTAYSQKDGSIWLSLYPIPGENNNKPVYVKFFSDMLDWKTLQEQGAMTVEEQKAAEEEKNKSTFDKISDFVATNGKWLLLAWVAKSAVENKKQ